MRVEFEQTFDDYLRSADEATSEHLNAGGPLNEALRNYYDFFAYRLWVKEFDIPLSAMFLSTNAFHLFLAAMRAAMSGHSSAAFPLLRTSLESACYAFLIAKDPGAEAIWMNRHDNNSSREKCRTKFSGAISFTRRRLNELQAGSGDDVQEAYNVMIDDGAHPNPRSIFRRMRFSEHNDQRTEVSFTALYSFDHFETTRSLVACLDIGLVVAIVLLRSLDDPAEELFHEVNQLNDLKESVVEQLNGGAPDHSAATPSP